MCARQLYLCGGQLMIPQNQRTASEAPRAQQLLAHSRASTANSSLQRARCERRDLQWMQQLPSHAAASGPADESLEQHEDENAATDGGVG